MTVLKGNPMKTNLYRCVSAEGSDLVRETSHYKAAITYRDVLKERGVEKDGFCTVYILTEPSLTGLVYEAVQTPHKFNMNTHHVTKVA